MFICLSIVACFVNNFSPFLASLYRFCFNLAESVASVSSLTGLFRPSEKLVREERWAPSGPWSLCPSSRGSKVRLSVPPFPAQGLSCSGHSHAPNVVDGAAAVDSLVVDLEGSVPL